MEARFVQLSSSVEIGISRAAAATAGDGGEAEGDEAAQGITGAMGSAMWKKELRLGRYSYCTKGGAPRRASRGDEDEKWEAEKNRKELFVEPCSGSLVSFLDDFEV